MPRVLLQPLALDGDRTDIDRIWHWLCEVRFVTKPGWDSDEHAVEGGCSCGNIRYRLLARPLFVHCCHCRWCQRESGAAFAINALIESDLLRQCAGEVQLIATPSESGQGQSVARCPDCQVALWSFYSSAGPHLSFVRVGTLDNPDRLPPDIHIFTGSKQPWVSLPEGVPALSEYYDRREYWPPDRLQRYQALLPAIRAFRAGTSQ